MKFVLSGLVLLLSTLASCTIQVHFKDLENVVDTVLKKKPCSDVVNRVVYFTAANEYFLDTLYLQKRIFGISGLSCLYKSFITICMDEVSYMACVRLRLHCVRTDVNVSASDFDQQDYWMLTVVGTSARNAIMQVLPDTDEFMLCNTDADIVFFQDPEKFIDGKKDILYLAEGTGNNCNVGVNGGFVCFKNSPAGRRTVETLAGMSDLWIKGHEGAVDQAVLHRLASENHATICSFEENIFITYCSYSFNHSAALKDVILFHTACLVGARDKHIALSVFSLLRKYRSDLALGSAHSKISSLLS